MPSITFVFHDGTRQEVSAPSGHSIMQVASDNNIEGIIAECGGSCSCATCHCYVDEAWADKLEAPSAMEKEMLTCVLNEKANSRLSCQVKVTDALDGIAVHVPESQF